MITDEKDTMNENGSCGAEAQSPCDAACNEQLAKVQTQLIYLKADFENFRRNVEKERLSWIASAQGRVLTDLLCVLDNMERALKDLAAGALSAQETVRFQGVELIYRELLALLKRYEVTEIPTDGLFDPVLHEALAQIDGENKKAGSIVEVVQRGYRQRDTVLRPAKVIVARRMCDVL